MNAKVFLQQIKEEFPEITWSEHRYLTHGWIHNIIILDDKIVFRTPKIVSKDSQRKLFDEIQLLSYLKNKVRIGIPEYTYISKCRTIAGYKMLAGQELKPSQFKRLSASEKEIIAKQLAAFITSLHATPKSVLKKCHVKTDDDQKMYYELVRDTKKLIFPHLTKTDIQVIKRYFIAQESALGHKYPYTLVHNDLKWQHILWDKKKQQINIIDFTTCSYGDSASDFAGLMDYGLKFAQRVFSLYEGKKDKRMLERAKLYYQMISLLVMRGAFLDYKGTFKLGYTMFKKRFKLKSAKNNI